jgi:hypothetical protein
LSAFLSLCALQPLNSIGQTVSSQGIAERPTAPVESGACYDRRVIARLPPTSDELLDDSARPYFLWWTNASVGELRRHLASADADERAYWMGALLREANTRDVWAFVRPDAITALWPKLERHLGRARSMWAYLLGVRDDRAAPRIGAAARGA